jgi:hypothetical protein
MDSHCLPVSNFFTFLHGQPASLSVQLTQMSETSSSPPILRKKLHATGQDSCKSPPIVALRKRRVIQETPSPQQGQMTAKTPSPQKFPGPAQKRTGSKSSRNILPSPQQRQMPAKTPSPQQLPGPARRRNGSKSSRSILPKVPPTLQEVHSSANGTPRPQQVAIQSGVSRRSAFLACKFFEHQSKEDRDGESVSGSSNSDDDDESDDSCITHGSYSDGSYEAYAKGWSSQASAAGHGTPLHMKRNKERESVVDSILEGIQRRKKDRRNAADAAALAALTVPTRDLENMTFATCSIPSLSCASKTAPGDVTLPVPIPGKPTPCSLSLPKLVDFSGIGVELLTMPTRSSYVPFDKIASAPIVLGEVGCGVRGLRSQGFSSRCSLKRAGSEYKTTLQDPIQEPAVPLPVQARAGTEARSALQDPVQVPAVTIPATFSACLQSRYALQETIQAPLYTLPEPLRVEAEARSAVQNTIQTPAVSQRASTFQESLSLFVWAF